MYIGKAQCYFAPGLWGRDSAARVASKEAFFAPFPRTPMDEVSLLDNFGGDDVDLVPQVVDPSLIPEAAETNSKKSKQLVKTILSKAAEVCTDPNGNVDTQEMVGALRNALRKVDKDYARAVEGSLMLDSLSAGLARQGKEEAIRKLKHAVAELVVHDCSPNTFSVTAVRSRLGYGGALDDPCTGTERRKRPAPPSVDVLLAAKRTKRRDALPLSVGDAVAAFAYCYCKFTEDKCACLLTKEQVWGLYNVFHDRDGEYYPEGNSIHCACHIDICSCIRATSHL